MTKNDGARSLRFLTSFAAMSGWNGKLPEPDKKCYVCKKACWKKFCSTACEDIYYKRKPKNVNKN